MSHVTLRTGIIFAKFEVGQFIPFWFITFYCWYVTSHCNLDIWPLGLQRFRVFRLSRDQTLYQIRGKSNCMQWSYCDFNMFTFGPPS